jgi:FAD/FMN-containing dehydrogenase/Fe-S oxidoreductase
MRPAGDLSDRARMRAALGATLERTVRGEVRFDAGSRALYATDASNYRQVPLGVVLPRDIDDVIATHAACREFDAPLVNRGGGTSLAGQACNEAVVIDSSKYMNAVLEIDPGRRHARVQPGVVLDDLRRAAGAHGLTFGPDPSTHDRCTLGGMLGNNSCGVHSIKGRRTADNVHTLDVLTYDGTRMTVGPTSDEEFHRIVGQGGRAAEIYRDLQGIRDDIGDEVRARFPDIPRRVSGYNLSQLLPEHGFHVARALVGTESTCVTVLEATLHLIDAPGHTVLVVLGYPDVFEAAADVPAVLEFGPIGLEGIDDYLIENMARRGMHEEERRALPEGGGWLIVEFDGRTREEAGDRARALLDRVAEHASPPAAALLEEAVEQERIWTLRESALGATARERGQNETWEGWEDAAVPPERLDGYLREFRSLLQRYGYRGSLYGHFGDGCVHTRINFDLLSEAGVKAYRGFIEDASDLVLRHGGSLSGEHGDGQSRGALLPKMYGEDIVAAFRRFKHAWDPQGKMNPGKVVEPYAPTQNLRLGPEYAPPELETYFRFPADGGSFARATLRCVGVGACRKHDSGTMCPSYMGTREEKHSTRGRARLLFEMLQGDPLKGGWRSEELKEALDLCLGCKACKQECPVQVDMATYKAEFLAHYHESRWRPRKAHFLGRIDGWSRLAGALPRLANFATQTPGLKRLASAIVGIHPARNFPPYAHQTFRRWFARRDGRHGPGGRPVLLWPDTYNNYFYPDTARAAVRLLEAAGCAPRLPQKLICCGRPLYDFGLLDEARKRLLKIIALLQKPIREGIPVVFLEPSCLSVFRDEMLDLLPDDEDAARLAAQSVGFGDFLEAQLGGLELDGLGGRALYHGHCHHKALFGTASSERLLRHAGLDLEVPDSGCCGMGGTFGFEHYELSRDIGERVLFPAVNRAPEGTFIITEGFSCREQLRQMTRRESLHLADVLAMSLPGHRTVQDQNAHGTEENQ